MQVEIKRQLTIALENYPGRLAAVSSAIAKLDINIEAISLIDNIEQGVIRLIASDPLQCRTGLAEQGFYIIEADVLAVSLTNWPGQLSRLSHTLAQAGINIEYTYGSTVTAGDPMRLMLKVSELQRAHQILAELEDN